MLPKNIRNVLSSRGIADSQSCSLIFEDRYIGTIGSHRSGFWKAYLNKFSCKNWIIEVIFGVDILQSPLSVQQMTNSK